MYREEVILGTMAVAENWEDLLDELEEPAPSPSPPKSAPAPKPPKAATSSYSVQDEVLPDPVAERLRQRRLVEENEKRLMEDLFAGCERPEAAAAPSELEQRPLVTVKEPKAHSGDPMEAIQLKTYRDCERLVESLTPKILDSPAKSPAWLRLLDLLLKECTPKMDLKDLRTLQGKLNASVAERTKAELAMAQKKKKPNDVGSQCRNYKDELDIVYGGDSEEEEEEEDEDEEEFI